MRVSNVISQVIILQLQSMIDQVKQRSNVDEVRIIAPQQYKETLRASFPNECVDCDPASDGFPAFNNIFIVPKNKPSPVTLIIQMDLETE